MSKSVPLFWLEDIYWTGILAGKLRIRHLYAPSFSGSTKYPADPCVFRVKDTVHLTDGGVIALKDTWKASRKAHLKCASPRRRNRKAADASVVYVLCIFVLFCALFALALTVAVNADTKIKDKEQHKKRTAERVMK
ncbi:uncharacterized protein LOC141907553 [Tubulanus polymorphus]|uniref:uncharacterized protein LOC141907553 n=1 Tax=Tubulanus polymorphus TaxID=672921 RepID=UPI003DA2C565